MFETQSNRRRGNYIENGKEAETFRLGRYSNNSRNCLSKSEETLRYLCETSHAFSRESVHSGERIQRSWLSHTMEVYPTNIRTLHSL